MHQLSSEQARELYAQTYDATMVDWPGEIDFYLEMASVARESNQTILEVACGTGRVAIRLAQSGIQVVGLDRSNAMLAVARKNSQGIPILRWVEGDMRSFDLGERFGQAIIPGHSFQNLLTAQDQLDCLSCIRRHLLPGSRLIVHLDHPELDWLAALTQDQAGVFEAGEAYTHPLTGQRMRTSQAWNYEPASQTATLLTVWEVLDQQGLVLDQYSREPIELHVVFPSEMEHLLSRAGYQVQAIYGDFYRAEFNQNSPSMIWVAVNPDSI